tara:strand:- start:137 stop:298 length:162 start_codon:yes stop_codon:yes gene_type:complete
MQVLERFVNLLLHFLEVDLLEVYFLHHQKLDKQLLLLHHQNLLKTLQKNLLGH